MSSVPIRNCRGETVGEWDIAEPLLVRDRGDQAVRDAVVAYQAAMRAGSASTLTKGEVAGSGSKPYRQKGTGRSRAGYIRSPIRRGGGVAHGPKPRSHAVRLTKKTAKLALRRAFTLKVDAEEWMVLDELTLPEPRTRHIADVVRALGSPKSLLLVVPERDEGLWKATRNLPHVVVTTAARVGTMALLRFDGVAVTRDAMSLFEKRLEAPVRRSS